MWKERTVEQALFRWQKWCQSIVKLWIKYQGEPEKISLPTLRKEAKNSLHALEFPNSPYFEYYWICCVSSCFNFENKSTFKNIVVPSWLPQPYYQLSIQGLTFTNETQSGSRVYPPSMYSKEDIKIWAYKLNTTFYKAKKLIFNNEDGRIIYLSRRSPFYIVLNKVTGRPKSSERIRKPSPYADLVVVKCALFKGAGMTYVDIARKVGLPVKRPFFTYQSDVARYCVRKGRELIRRVLDNDV